MPAKRLTTAEVREQLKKLGLVFKKTEAGDYRVNFRGAPEASAYYTDDLGDALSTGHVMAEKARRSSEPPSCPTCESKNVGEARGGGPRNPFKCFDCGQYGGGEDFGYW